MTQAIASQPRFDIQRIRSDFPILRSLVHGKPLVYLDNGATTQKPQAVIDAIARYYESENANIHRAVHTLSQTATRLYEEAREKVRAFINAKDSAEIIFTRGTTESINLVASCLGRLQLGKGDEVIVSAMEHHSNIVPWQMICQSTGAILKVIPMTDAGELRMDEYRKLLSDRTRIISVVHVSNSLGTINPVEEIIRLARQHTDAKVLIDGAQWIAHRPTDVQAMDCDFYAFSGHKLFGPTGIGVLYGKRELLEAMPPYQGGGDMIESVTFAKTTYAQLPNKFEAGTPNIEGAIGLAAAIDYVQSIGLESSAQYEDELLEYAQTKLAAIPGLKIIGTAENKASVISFVIEKPTISPYDLGIALDREGIAVRTGHHCCQPVMDRLGITGTTRASLAMYNTRADVDALVAALERIVRNFKPTPIRPAASTSDNVKWPEAKGDSPQSAAKELVETFEMLGDWETRDQYLLELGDKLSPLPVVAKIEANRVHGCMSIVHLIGRKRPGSTDIIEFLADSDAPLVRGLIAVLQYVYCGQSSAKVLKFDIDTFLKQLGLDTHLSMGRRNGLAGMIRKIHALAHDEGSR